MNATSSTADASVADEDAVGSPLASSAARQDVDFTDLLWSVLYKVESYSELCFALQSVLERIKREELRPFVSGGKRLKVESMLSFRLFSALRQ